MAEMRPHTHTHTTHTWVLLYEESNHLLSQLAVAPACMCMSVRCIDINPRTQEGKMEFNMWREGVIACINTFSLSAMPKLNYS